MNDDNNNNNEDKKDASCHDNVTNNPTSITSTSPTNDNKNNNNTHNNNNNNNNKKRKNTWFKSTWNKNPKDDTSPPDPKTKLTRREINRNRSPDPHEGSFAHPLMQQLFPSSSPSSSPIPSPSSSNKRPKRKVALLVAFLGTNYSGMQINKRQRTIQAALERALYLSRCLSLSNYGHPHKYSWSNAARTDKGVHSCAQVCSLKIELPEECGSDENMDAVRRGLNENLPEDIRVLDVVKTTKSFCAKTQREKVRYQYMIPSFLFLGRERLAALWNETRRSHKDDDGRPLHPMGIPPTTAKRLHATHLAPYRIAPTQLATLQTALSLFEGTHSFHNYTSRKTAADPSSRRYIRSITVHAPIVNDDDAQWIPVTVVGQSFLLHQIRKMMGMAIEVARGATTLEVTRDSLTERSMVLGLAPAQGLFLDMSYYGLYNKKKVDHEDLVWHDDDEDGYGDGDERRQKRRSEAMKRWKAFKEEIVVTHVMEEEEREFNFVKWLFTQEFLFDRKNYLRLSETPNDEDDDDDDDNDDAKEKGEGKVGTEDTTTTTTAVSS